MVDCLLSCLKFVNKAWICHGTLERIFSKLFFVLLLTVFGSAIGNPIEGVYVQKSQLSKSSWPGNYRSETDKPTDCLVIKSVDDNPHVSHIYLSAFQTGGYQCVLEGFIERRGRKYQYIELEGDSAEASNVELFLKDGKIRFSDMQKPQNICGLRGDLNKVNFKESSREIPWRKKKIPVDKLLKYCPIWNR